MRRTASITLLAVFLCLTLSPLAALAGQSHPMGCPRVTSTHQCHGTDLGNSERIIQAQPPDCPMRCCATVRSGATYAPVQRVVLTALNVTSCEAILHQRSAFLTYIQGAFERGPPLA